MEEIVLIAIIATALGTVIWLLLSRSNVTDPIILALLGIVMVALTSLIIHWGLTP